MSGEEVRKEIATLVSSNRCFDGVQRVYRHMSSTCNCEMSFGVYVPDHGDGEKLATLFYLAGLTGTHAVGMERAGAQRFASKHRIVLVTPDTSPRGDAVPDSTVWGLGHGASFYVNAAREPWRQHYQMRSYVEEELPSLLRSLLRSFDLQRLGITGHSAVSRFREILYSEIITGGHGALTFGLRRPDLFRSVSALAPIAHATRSPTARNSFKEYLGEDESKWAQYDAVLLAAEYCSEPRRILVDQGKADELIDRLMPDTLKSTDRVHFDLRYHDGHDHGYFFIMTFIGDHIDFHAAILNKSEAK